MSQTTIPAAQELTPTAPKLRGALKATADTIKQQAIGLYEDLVWKAAENGQGIVELPALDTETFGVLHGASKSIDDFVADVDAIKRRIALQDDIAEHHAVAAEQSKVAEKKRALEAELARVTAEYEARIGEADAELRELGHREQAVRPAVRHYFKTAPAWIRERRESLRKEYDRLLSRIKNRGSADPHLQARDAELVQQRAFLEDTMLLLRPTPEDLARPQV